MNPDEATEGVIVVAGTFGYSMLRPPQARRVRSSISRTAAERSRATVRVNPAACIRDARTDEQLRLVVVPLELLRGVERRERVRFIRHREAQKAGRSARR